MCVCVNVQRGWQRVRRLAATVKCRSLSDGSAELALAGPAFFRAIWMDEIVINQIEIRPMAIDSLEFDAAGSAEIGFVAIKPGRYELGVPGARGDSQIVKISIQ